MYITKIDFLIKNSENKNVKWEAGTKVQLIEDYIDTVLVKFPNGSTAEIYNNYLTTSNQVITH